MTSFFLPVCLYELSPVADFCCVLISENIYISYIGHNTVKGSSAQNGIYFQTTYNGINTTRNVRINVTFWRVCVTAVEVEKQVLQILRACVFNLGYPARHGHAPFCHLWSVRLYHTFPHYLLNDTFVGRGVTGQKMRVLSLPTIFFPETLLTLIGIQLNTICVHTSLCNIPIMPVRFS